MNNNNKYTNYNELLTELVGSVNLDPETLKTFLPYIL